MSNNRYIAAFKAARDEFRAAADRSLQQARELDREIAELEEAEKRAAREKVLTDISPNAKEGFKSTDVTFFISSSSGDEYRNGGFADSAFSFVHTISESLKDVEGAKISAFQWGRDLVPQLDTSRADNLKAARNREDTPHKNEIIKFEGNEVTRDSRLLPLVKKLLDWNTPDNQNGKPQHYIIIAPGLTSDKKEGPSEGLEHAEKIIGMILKINQKANIDVVVCGNTPYGWMLTPRPGLCVTPVRATEDMSFVLAGIVKKRLPTAPQVQVQPSFG